MTDFDRVLPPTRGKSVKDAQQLQTTERDSHSHQLEQFFLQRDILDSTRSVVNLTKNVVILFSAEESWPGIRTHSVPAHRLQPVAECVSDLSYITLDFFYSE